MADRKFYWLKLKQDFFKRHDIKIIEAMPNGKDYVLFYLKLLVESLSHDGKLRFSDTIPYSEQMLSVITNTNIDVVKSAMDIFVGLRLIEIMDDQTIYLQEVEQMTGSETEWAEKKRIYRQNEDNVLKLSSQNRTMSDKSKSIEIEKEIEKDNKEITGEKSPCPYSQILDFYSEICKSFPKLTKLSDARKKAIKARLNSGYTLDDFKKLFETAEASSFLKGKNNRNWAATFDWLIKDANMAKVLDGNYANKAGPGTDPPGQPQNKKTFAEIIAERTGQ